MSADVVLINGQVMTVDPINPVASAVAIRAGRVVHVGSDADARAAAGPRAEVIDLRGRTATPGLNDAHAHPMSVGQALLDVDITPERVGSIEGIGRAVKARLNGSGPGNWIIGRGYDQARMTDQRHPTRADLDAVAPNNPVFLYRACHHIVAVNSAALKFAGITASTRDPEGGTIDRDEHGEPTGVLRESAIGISARPYPRADPRTRSCARWSLPGRAFLRTGVTSTVEAGIRDPKEMSAYQRLRQSDALPVRTYLMMMIDETLEHMAGLGIKTGFGDAWLRIGPAKLFLDGSIGGRTCRMRQPFEGEAENVGLWMEPPDVMKSKVIKAHRSVSRSASTRSATRQSIWFSMPMRRRKPGYPRPGHAPPHRALFDRRLRDDPADQADWRGADSGHLFHVLLHTGIPPECRRTEDSATASACGHMPSKTSSRRPAPMRRSCRSRPRRGSA